MSLETSHSFEFGEGLPISPVEGGNSLLVTGPAAAGLDTLVHELLAPGDDAFRIVECNGSKSADDAAVSVSDPGKLSDVNVHLSSLADDLRFDGTEAVRTGIYSAVPMVAAAGDMRDIYRFLQNSISRPRRNDNLFVCVMDPEADLSEIGDGDHIVTGLSKAFQGQIELRGDRRDAEVRVTGLDG